jgi:hypothetical protein
MISHIYTLLRRYWGQILNKISNHKADQAKHHCSLSGSDLYLASAVSMRLDSSARTCSGSTQTHLSPKLMRIADFENAGPVVF